MTSGTEVGCGFVGCVSNARGARLQLQWSYHAIHAFIWKGFPNWGEPDEVRRLVRV